MASKLYMLGGYTPSHAHTVMMMHNSILAVMPITLLSLASFSECGTHLDKPWFNWEGGKVPFYFNATVTNDDRVMIRHMMKQIEKKSCVRFREQTKPPSGNAPYYLLCMMSQCTWWWIRSPPGDPGAQLHLLRPAGEAQVQRGGVRRAAQQPARHPLQRLQAGGQAGVLGREQGLELETNLEV